MEICIQIKSNSTRLYNTEHAQLILSLEKSDAFGKGFIVAVGGSTSLKRQLAGFTLIVSRARPSLNSMAAFFASLIKPPLV